MYQIGKGGFLMEKFRKYLFLWAVGGSLYYGIELLYRGFSHWSMFILGGICFLFYGFLGEETQWHCPVWKQLLACMIFITSCEFISGIILNKWLHLGVWDYSSEPFNLLGQVCLPYALIFGVLSLFGIRIYHFLDQSLFTS
jgi:uncharacterized membrane protein